MFIVYLNVIVKYLYFKRDLLLNQNVIIVIFVTGAYDPVMQTCAVARRIGILIPGMYWLYLSPKDSSEERPIVHVECFNYRTCKSLIIDDIAEDLQASRIQGSNSEPANLARYINYRKTSSL